MSEAQAADEGFLVSLVYGVDGAGSKEEVQLAGPSLRVLLVFSQLFEKAQERVYFGGGAAVTCRAAMRALGLGTGGESRGAYEHAAVCRGSSVVHAGRIEGERGVLRIGGRGGCLGQCALGEEGRRREAKARRGEWIRRKSGLIV